MEAKRAKLCLPDEADVAAVEKPIQALCEVVICSICLEYFKDPVITECGHNFCLSCLTPCWEESEEKASCPQCREKIQERNIRPNRKLASVVEIAKKLSLQGPKVEERKGEFCEKHQEPLKLFCEQDKIPICVVCDRSKEHRGHEVVPQEEAYQKTKDLISNHLGVLKKEREDILANKGKTERESQHLLFLEEEENRRVDQMEQVEEEIGRKRVEHLAKLSGQLSSIESLIKEMEEKYQQPSRELLQDVSIILERSERKKTSGDPGAFPPELRFKIRDLTDINPFLAQTMKKFKGSLLLGLQLHEAGHRQNKCNPDNMKRFNTSPSLFRKESCCGTRDL